MGVKIKLFKFEDDIEKMTGSINFVGGEMKKLPPEEHLVSACPLVVLRSDQSKSNKGKERPKVETKFISVVGKSSFTQ